MTKSYEELVSEAKGETKQTGVEEVHDALERGEEVTVVDVREPDEWEAGHVPGAKHLHADTLLDPESGTFRSDEGMRERLREAGVPEDRDASVVAYCNGGVAATVPLFAMYRLGYRNLANYDGSWNEWGGRENLPTES